MKKHILSGRRGQAMAELAVTIMVFFMFLLALADIVRIYNTWMTMQFAVNEGARWGSLGNTTTGLGREDSIRQHIAARMNQFNMPISAGDVVIDPPGAPNIPLALYRVSVSRNLPVSPVTAAVLGITGNNTSRVSAEVMTRNENF